MEGARSPLCGSTPRPEDSSTGGGVAVLQFHRRSAVTDRKKDPPWTLIEKIGLWWIIVVVSLFSVWTSRQEKKTPTASTKIYVDSVPRR